MSGADVLSVMLARGMMCDVRHPRQEEARWLAQGGGYIRRSSWAELGRGSADVFVDSGDLYWTDVKWPMRCFWI